MIRQIKMGLKLLRYSHGVTLSMGIAAALVLLAITIEFVPVFGSRRLLGDYLLLMNGLWLVQQIYSVNITSLVQTSQWKKKLQTSVPVLLGFCGFAVSYLVIILIKLPGLVGAGAEQQAAVSMTLLVDAVIGVWTMIYCGVAYKSFIPSTIVFFVIFYAWFLGTAIFESLPQINLPVWAAAGAGYLILVAGALLQYGMTRLFYHFPLDKRGQMRGLQKYM